jgi:hypothetical protein
MDLAEYEDDDYADPENEARQFDEGFLFADDHSVEPEPDYYQVRNLWTLQLSITNFDIRYKKI